MEEGEETGKGGTIAIVVVVVAVLVVTLAVAFYKLRKKPEALAAASSTEATRKRVFARNTNAVPGYPPV